MAFSSFAEWQARHSPQYITKIEQMRMQRQISIESEDRRYSNQIDLLNRSNAQQWEMARYKEDQATQRENERGRVAVAVEQERGGNRLAELDRELSNKIRLIGAETQVAMAMRFIDELAKDAQWFRDALMKQVEFRMDMQKEILRAMLAEKLAQSGFWRDIEKMKIDYEHKARLIEIDDFTKKAMAYSEFVAQKAGEKAGADAVDSILSKWAML